MLERVRIVLVRPRRGGNVGAVARAMKNMGLDELVLVAPRTRVGEVGARMAAHARDVLDARRVERDLAAAVRDCRLVVGTVGREVDPRGRVGGARELAGEVVAAAGRGRVALVFGPEDHGLSNAELDLCQRWLRIPTGGPYASLNLAQAVLVCAYEVMLAALGGEEPAAAARSGAAAGPRAASAAQSAGRSGAAVAASARRERQSEHLPATSGEREAMLDHLGEALLSIGFLSAQNPAHILRDVRSLFARAGLTRRDVRIWRGVARQVLWVSRAAQRPVRGDAGEIMRPRKPARAAPRRG